MISSAKNKDMGSDMSKKNKDVFFFPAGDGIGPMSIEAESIDEAHAIRNEKINNLISKNHE